MTDSKTRRSRCACGRGRSSSWPPPLATEPARAADRLPEFAAFEKPALFTGQILPARGTRLPACSTLTVVASGPEGLLTRTNAVQDGAACSYSLRVSATPKISLQVFRISVPGLWKLRPRLRYDPQPGEFVAAPLTFDGGP